jgi:hypothetical protein
MRNYHNIEKSAFRHGQYVGWDKDGNRYSIRRDGPNKDRGSWWVYPKGNSKSNPMPVFYAGTLALVSLRLERKSAICARPRLLHETV